MSSLSVVKISLDIAESKKWLANFLSLQSLDELECIDEIEFNEDDSFTSIIDNSGTDIFFGLDINAWYDSLQDNILYYAHYDEDNGNVEYVHIEKKEIVRDYRMYDFNLDTNEGSNPSFDDFSDALSYIDDHFLE